MVPKAALAPFLLVGLLGLLLGGCATPPLGPGDQERIAGRTFVVTGASSGFGRGVAMRLAAGHANLVLAARRTNVLDGLAAEVRAAGGTPLVVTTDVSKPEDIQRLADAAVARFGRIDVWINNAGVVAIGPFWDIPVRDEARVIDVNLKGVLYGSHAAIRQFRAQGFGTLVNVGSVESKVPLAYQAAYSASKAGVLNLGQALNQELRLGGMPSIKVVTVMPWAANTPLWEHAANYTGGTPTMPAMDDAQKVADAIVWASLHPVPELPVGWKAQAVDAFHQFMPGLTERFSADLSREYEIGRTPATPPTSGALFVPMQSGTTVEEPRNR
jgi:short-subunit dehydrogenase